MGKYILAVIQNGVILRLELATPELILVCYKELPQLHTYTVNTISPSTWLASYLICNITKIQSKKHRQYDYSVNHLTDNVAMMQQTICISWPDASTGNFSINCTAVFPWFNVCGPFASAATIR